MNRNVWETLTKYQMLTQGDRVCAAVSGGADSVALLAFLWENRETLGITLTACHLNHRLRGEESDRDEAFVRDLCGGWGIPLTVEHRQVGELARRDHLSLEECGRRERYRLFEQIAQNEGCKIATAHTRSDSMETVLLNLARGTGLRGLGGIPPVRGAIIRPLIDCTRRQVEEYCARQGLSYVTDSSNLGDDYTRNAIRHQVVPVLYRANPAADRAMARLMETAAETDAFLEKLAGEAEEKIARAEGGWSCRGLLDLERPVARQLLARLAARAGTGLTTRQGELCLELAGRGGVLELENTVNFSARQGRFAFVPRQGPAMGEEYIFPVEGLEQGPVEICLPDGNQVLLCLLDCEQSKNFEESQKQGLKNQLDYGTICGTVFLRSRLPGDRLRQPGRGVGKSLKKLFNEGGVPLEERGRRAILSDDEGPLWVEGFGPDARAVVGGDTKKILRLQVRPPEDRTDG